MQSEIAKTITDFVTTVTTAYVDTTKKVYEANMTLVTEMTKAFTKSVKK
jgi:hypothetical protein